MPLKDGSESEEEFQEWVTDYCDVLHLKWHHETDSRRSPEGYPDLTIVGPGGVLWLELKSAKGKPTKQQREWLYALRAAGQQAFVARPKDREIVERKLLRLAGRTPAA